jgi:hypothetical protein
MRLVDPGFPIGPHFRRGVSSKQRSRRETRAPSQSTVFTMSGTNLDRIGALRFIALPMALGGGQDAPLRVGAPVD